MPGTGSCFCDGTEHIHVTPGPGMRAAVLAAAGLPDLAPGPLSPAPGSSDQAFRNWYHAEIGHWPVPRDLIGRTLRRAWEAGRQYERDHPADTATSASRQHYIDTGSYLEQAELAHTDPAAFDHDVRCTQCGKRLCTAEVGDSIGVLARTAYDHEGVCPGSPDDRAAERED